jgi:hypothetical protein
MVDVDVALSTKTSLTVGEDTLDIVQDFRGISAKQTALGGTCQGALNDGEIHWKNDCQAVDRFIVTKQEINGQKGAQEGTEAFDAFVYKDLIEPTAPSAWYAGGGFNVRIGNWNGTVAYTNASTPPSYTLSDGTTTLNGVVGRGSTSSLTDDVPVASSVFARAVRQAMAKVSAAGRN